MHNNYIFEELNLFSKIVFNSMKYKNMTILKQNTVFILFLTLLLVISACQNSTHQDEAVKVYNIPELDKLSVEIAKNPDNAALYAARSTFFTENELYKEAEVDAEKAVALDSTQIDYYRLLSNAYFDNNHSLSAIKTAEQAIEKFPNSKETYLMLGEMLLVLEQYQDGLMTIDKLMKVAPNNPDGLFIQGQILKEMGDTLQALDRYQTVVEQDADHLDAYVQLALLTQGRPDELNLRYLDNVLRIDSMNVTALLARAQHYHFQAKFEQALKEYKIAILRQPQEPDFNYNLAMMYLEMGKIAEKSGNKEETEKHYKNAFHHFDNTTKFAPQFADAYFYKGIAAEQLGKNSTALQDYENAFRLQGFLGTIKPYEVEKAIDRLKK